MEGAILLGPLQNLARSSSSGILQFTCTSEPPCVLILGCSSFGVLGMSVKALGGSQCLAMLAKACVPPWKVALIISVAAPRGLQSRRLKNDSGEWGNTPQGRKLDTLGQLCLLERSRWG